MKSLFARDVRFVISLFAVLATVCSAAGARASDPVRRPNIVFVFCDDHCNGNRFNGDQQTFPKLLQKAGYQAAELARLRRELKVPDLDPPETARGRARKKPPTKK